MRAVGSEEAAFFDEGDDFGGHHDFPSGVPGSDELKDVGRADMEVRGVETFDRPDESAADKVLEEQFHAGGRAEIFAGHQFALRGKGGIHIEPHVFFEKAAESFENAAFEIGVVRGIENLDQPRNAHWQANRLLSVASQKIHQPIILAVVGDQHGAAERGEHVDAVEEVVQPADTFYKKPILVERGSFRPVTLITNDMLDGALRLFEKEEGVAGGQPEILMEITTKNLLASGNLDLHDFLDRVDMLAALGRTVLISDYGEYYRLVNFLTRYTERPVGLPMGIPGLVEIFNPAHYADLEGGILEALGRLFKKNVRLYVYPALSPTGELVTCENFRPPEGMELLYRHLRESGLIRSIEGYNAANLSIRSPQVVQMIASGDDAWEAMVPPEVVRIIRERGLFGAGKSFH